MSFKEIFDEVSVNGVHVAVFDLLDGGKLGIFGEVSVNGAHVTVFDLGILSTSKVKLK